MATTNSATLKSGTWLVIGMLALATLLVISSRVYRTPPPEDEQEILQQQGIPAARRGMDLSREGKKLLPLEEQHEMDALYAEALQALTPEERQQLLTIAQKGTAANDQEGTESAGLIQKALRLLPQDKGARLAALVEKAGRVQPAQAQAPAAAG